jgi:heterodisulfide reductase subunit A2
MFAGYRSRFHKWSDDRAQVFPQPRQELQSDEGDTSYLCRARVSSAQANAGAMGGSMRIGVYICEAGGGTAGAVNLEAVAHYAANLPQVESVQVLGLLPKLDPEKLADGITSERLDRIVIAGDSPGFFKPAFTRAMALAGREPDEVRLASFREHGAAAVNSTERAKAIVSCAVYGVPFALAATPTGTKSHPATLVVGGGVAGIQAALEIADAGKKVYLVERTGTIGGHMAMFDKTFPTLDCAACILTPKMVAVGQHEMIELMTYSEVEAIGGSPGSYKVTILRNSRRVDEEACVACGICTEVCPASAISEFDAGIATRKAIYIPFAQAVPNAYLVDESACTYVQSNGQKCGVCAKKCPKGCIDLDGHGDMIQIEVGSVVVATGFETLDAARLDRYGYGVHPNVLTALEFERLTNASGPTGGQIVTKTSRYNKRKKIDEWVFDPEGPPPKSVAIIHCVGSRDSNYNPYCSRVCCMYSLKFAHLVSEKLPEATCYEFYIDMRAFGKGYEEFFQRVKEEGTFVIRGRSALVGEHDGQMFIKGEDILSDRVLEFPVDMVLLSVGLVPAARSDQLAWMLGIPRDEFGWFTEADYNGDPTGTERGGVYVAGVCQAPKDIPDTVAQASAVAARVLKSAMTGRGLESLANLSLEDIEARAKSLVVS